MERQIIFAPSRSISFAESALLGGVASSALASAQAAAASALAAEAASELAQSIEIPPNATVPVVSRAALSVLVTALPAFLSEAWREGQFVWDPADLSALVAADTEEGIYVAPAADATGASGAWVRKFSGPASVRWFGATGDGVTDDSAAFVGALATLKALRVNTVALKYAGSPRLWIPAGHYFLGNTTLDITHTLIIEGDGVNSFSGASKLRWSAGTTGFRVQAANTEGATDTSVGTHLAGSGSVIRFLFLEGGYATSATEGEFHGVHMRAGAIVEDCAFKDFEGDCVHIEAEAGGTLPGTPEGNSNCWAVNRIYGTGCRDVLFVKGADTNAGSSCQVKGQLNRRWCINDISFLNNTHTAPQSADNGKVPDSIPSGVEHMGNIYYVVAGQEAWASVNAPSGTTADNAGWLYDGPGVVAPTHNIAAWVSGTEYRAGGSYHTEEASRVLFVGPYAEGGHGPPQVVFPALMIGGIIGGLGVRGGGGAHVKNVQGEVVTTCGIGSRSLDGLTKTILGSGSAGIHLTLVHPSAPDGYQFKWVSGNFKPAYGGSNLPANYPYEITGIDTTRSVGVHKLNFPIHFGIADKKMLNGAAAPVAGTYAKGDICWSTDPAASGTFGWFCSVAGTPGTWLPLNAVPVVQTVASAATVTPTFANDQVNITAQAAALLLANPTGTAIPAWGIVIRIKDNGTARAITYGNQYRAIGVALPATTVIGKTLYLGMIFNSTDTKWDVVSVAQEA